MKYVVLIICLTTYLVAQNTLLSRDNEPQWLKDLRVQKETPLEPVEVDKAPRPDDSKLGYWKIEKKEVRILYRTPPEDGAPLTRTVIFWSWIEEEVKFQGNVDSRVFHKEGCRYWDCRDCSAYFNSFDEAIDQGYKACRVCRPEESAD